MLNTIFFYFSMLVAVSTPFYFHYRVKKIQVSKDTIQHIEAISNKLTFLIIVALFGMGITAAHSKTSNLPESAFFTCLFSFYLLQTLHGKTVNPFKSHLKTPQENFQSSLRYFLSFLIPYALYFFTGEILIPHLGIIFSILIATLVVTYSLPLLIRVCLSATKMHHSELKNEIRGLFQRAGNTLGEVYLIEIRHSRHCNAFVCGPRFGFGPFRRSLFITQNMFEVLEAEEITAVLYHEAAHFKLNHLFKRSIFNTGIFLMTIIFFSFPGLFLTNLMNFDAKLSFSLVFAITIFTVYIQFYFMMKLSRKQEFEADQEAIRIGCNPNSLITALEKITAHNHTSRLKPEGISKYTSLNSHPGIDERIEAILTERIPNYADLIHNWQAGLSYASFVILAVLLAAVFQNSTYRNSAQDRGPASGQKLPTSPNPVKWNGNSDDSSLGN
jgi:Zn-dependent protease with chaperone function